MNEVDN